MTFAFLLWPVGICDPVMPVTVHLEMEADKLTAVRLAKQNAQQLKQAFWKPHFPPLPMQRSL